MSLDTENAIARLVDELRQALSAQANAPLIVGIRTGGLWLAQRLCRELSLPAPASLDISYHRDDVHRRGINPEVQPSELPLDLEDHDILLVDDVLHTGRTVRAAINELFDYGRPARIRLAVLVDRGERELPFAPDFVAERVRLEPGQRLAVDGPDPLRFRVVEA